MIDNAHQIAEERRQDAADTLASEAAKLRDALAEAAGGGTTFGGMLGSSVAFVANKIAEAEAAHEVWRLAASILRGALDAGTTPDPTRLLALLLDRAWSLSPTPRTDAEGAMLGKKAAVVAARASLDARLMA